jgi:DNA-binding transcriptional ArsR family regulator
MAVRSATESGIASTGDLLVPLKALADETRLRIFALLTRREMCVCEIEDVLGLSQSLVSNHLAVLRQAGLVRGRRDEEDARWIFYRAEPAAAAALRGRLGTLLDVSPAPADRRSAAEACQRRRR